MVKTTKKRRTFSDINASQVSNAIIANSKRSYLVDRSYLADKDAGHFLVAGRYVWIFYDEYMIVKSVTTEIKIPYKRYKPAGKCIRRPPPLPCVTKRCSSTAGQVEATDCVPRTIFGKHRSFDQRWRQSSLRGFWVFEDQVVVTLGSMQYYYKYDGTFIERKKNEKDWDLKIGPYAKSKWRVEGKYGQTSKVYFKDLAFDAVSVRFSGPWVAITQKSLSRENEYDYLLVHRATGKVQARYPTKEVRLRTSGDGFYGKGFWYGETIVDVRDEDPQRYCYAFKGKKKCVLTPKMSPSKRCFPTGRGEKCTLKSRSAKIYGLIETDDFILKVLSGKVVEITYDKENYYTKTHHFTSETYKHHLGRYRSFRIKLRLIKRDLRHFELRRSRRKKK